MSKISLIAAIVLGGLLACNTPAIAQDAKQGGKRPSLQQRVDKMAEDLKLTDEQKTKVKALFEDEAKKRQEMRDLPQDQRREKAKALAEESNKKMKEILKPDQFEKWEKMRQEMRKKGGKKTSDTTK